MQKFLRERNLTAAYRRDKAIKYKRRFNVDVDGEKVQVVAYRKNNKTIIADARTLRTLSTTKRYNTKTFIKGLIPKERIKNINNRPVKISEPDIKLDHVKRTRHKNFYLEHTKKKRNLVGQLILNITFSATKNGRKIKRTVEASSTGSKFLKNKSAYTRAYNEAFTRCVSQINFSYDDYKVNFEHYTYSYNYSQRDNRGF